MGLAIQCASIQRAAHQCAAIRYTHPLRGASLLRNERTHFDGSFTPRDNLQL